MKGLRGRRLLRDLPAFAAFVWAFVTLLQAHRFFLSPPALLHPLDEGYVNAFAWRMVSGQMLPFVDAVSHRGPLMYWAVAVAMKLGSPTSWVPIRVVSMICGLLTVAFTFGAGWRAGMPLTGAIGALAVVIVFVLGMPPIDGIGYCGEHLLNVFAMASLVCCVAALDRSRPRPSLALLAAAGALGALGALSKQLGVVSIVPLGLWVAATSVSRPGLDRRARWAMVAAFAVGVALPPLITALRYAAAGELRTLYYYTVKYNSEVYLGPYNAKAKVSALAGWVAGHGVLLGILAPIALWGVTRPLAGAGRLRDLPRAYDAHGFSTTVALSAFGVVLFSNTALRDFIHYYVQVAPWCGLLLGLIVERVIEERAPLQIFRPALVRALVLLPMILVLAIGGAERFEQHARDRKSKRHFGDLRASGICDYVRAHSKPEEPLFVWGFVPELYTSCERRPASRYVFTTFVAGFVPWFDRATKADDDARAVPRSREILVEELERSRPPVIVDAPKSMGNRPMQRYEVLARYLARNYCPGPTVEGYGTFLRRTGGGCPAVSK